MPLAVTTVIVAARFIWESRDDEAVHHVDWAGAFLATIGLGSIVYALISASGASWTLLDVVMLAGGFVLLALFVVVEQRVRSPMMPLRLFANRNFSAINLMTLLLYAALGGALFFMPFNLILVQHYSPTAAGAAFLPLIGLIFILSPWAGKLASSIGPRTPLVCGSVVAAIGFAGLAIPGIGGSYWSTFFPATLALGLGMGLVVAPLTTTVMNSVDPDHFGVASGINNAVARTAGLIAIAALSLAVVAAFDRGLDARLAQISAAPPVIAAVNAQRPHLASAQAPDFASPRERDEIRLAIGRSYIDGFRLAMLIAAGLALASALCALTQIRAAAPLPSGPGPRSP